MRLAAVAACSLMSLLGGAFVHAADGKSAARVVACDMTGVERSADFHGRMDLVPGAARMAMRFTLLERPGKGARWSRVDVPELREWRRSVSGVKTFSYRQSVANLRAGATYRARVQFRWTDAAGEVVHAESKRTAACRGALPNLRIGGLSVRPGPTEDTRTYRVRVENDGRAHANGVSVVVTVDRAVLDAARVKSLAPGGSRTVTFTGPACERGVQASVDPQNGIGESSEDDNSQLFTCP